jgi:hypothetical protein
MEACHDEIEAVKKMNKWVVKTFAVKKLSRQSAMMKLGLVFKKLHDKKSRGEKYAKDKVETNLVLFRTLSRYNRQSHGKTAGQEEKGIYGTHMPIEMLGPFRKGCGMQGKENKRAHEKCAKHHDFGGEKQPHSCLGGFELLLKRIEMMRDFVFF